jgi:hypothetical protein
VDGKQEGGYLEGTADASNLSSGISFVLPARMFTKTKEPVVLEQLR